MNGHAPPLWIVVAFILAVRYIDSMRLCPAAGRMQDENG